MSQDERKFLKNLMKTLLTSVGTLHLILIMSVGPAHVISSPGFLLLGLASSPYETSTVSPSVCQFYYPPPLYPVNFQFSRLQV